MADLVGELAAAPVLGLVDGAVETLDDLLDLRVQLGDLLVRRLRRQDVDELVLSVSCSCVSFWTERPLALASSDPVLVQLVTGMAGLRHRPAASSKEKIGLSIPSSSFVFFPVEPVHHRCDAFADEQLGGVALRGVTASAMIGRSSGANLRQHVIREIAPRLAAADPDAQPCELLDCRALR